MEIDMMADTRESGVEKYFLDLTGLLRNIQHAEEDTDRFCKAQDHCDRILCAWRPYCLENMHGTLS